jgi:hypothetical protein
MQCEGTYSNKLKYLPNENLKMFHSLFRNKISETGDVEKSCLNIIASFLTPDSRKDVFQPPNAKSSDLLLI